MKRFSSNPNSDGDFAMNADRFGGGRLGAGVMKSKGPSRKEIEKRDSKNSKEAKKRKNKKKKEKTRKRFPK
jgi:hypothetical protein